MSLTPPVMGVSFYTQGEWIVLLTQLPLPCHFFAHEKDSENSKCPQSLYSYGFGGNSF